MYRLALDETHVFRKKLDKGRPAVCLGILVDESGSMGRHDRDVMARQSAIMIYHALSGVSGVRLGIWGHTGDRQPFGSGCLVHRYIEPGTRHTPTLLGRIEGKGENYDGFAIEYVAGRMQKARRPGETCILIVLSDGSPSGKGYRGEAARKHTRDSILTARRSRVHVLGVGLGDDLSLDELGAIYGPEAVHVAEIARLPARLGQVVTRVLS